MTEITASLRPFYHRSEVDLIVKTYLKVQKEMVIKLIKQHKSINCKCLTPKSCSNCKLLDSLENKVVVKI